MRWLFAALVLVARVGWACDPLPAGSPFDGLCADVSGSCGKTAPILILSAFPYEQHVLRAAVKVTEIRAVEGRSVVVGWLGGQYVAIALTGIGFTNARTLTEDLLAHLDVSAIVFSGVAGSRLHLADVVVPMTWRNNETGNVYPVDPQLLATAAAVAPDVSLAGCQPFPLDPPGPTQCLPVAPSVVVGGPGTSDDVPGGQPFPCDPKGNDVTGCEPDPIAGSTPAPAAIRPEVSPPPVTVDEVDEETAIVAEIAAAHGIRFLGIRGVSDGAEDPSGFLKYYRIAADNAARVAIAVLGALPPPAGAARARVRDASRPGASCGFVRAAAPVCSGVPANRHVSRLVAKACALVAAADAADAARATKLEKRAGTAWRAAAKIADRANKTACCGDALAARLRAAAALASSADGAFVRPPATGS